MDITLTDTGGLGASGSGTITFDPSAFSQVNPDLINGFATSGSITSTGLSAYGFGVNTATFVTSSVPIFVYQTYGTGFLTPVDPTKGYADLVAGTNSLNFTSPSQNFTYNLDNLYFISFYYSQIELFNSESSVNDIFNVSYSLPGPAVPEPASLALLGAGVLGLSVLRRRKKSVH